MKTAYGTVLQYNMIKSFPGHYIIFGKERGHKCEFYDMSLPVRLFDLHFILFSSLGHSPPPNSTKHKGLKMPNIFKIIQKVQYCPHSLI